MTVTQKNNFQYKIITRVFSRYICQHVIVHLLEEASGNFSQPSRPLFYFHRVIFFRLNTFLDARSVFVSVPVLSWNSLHISLKNIQYSCPKSSFTIFVCSRLYFWDCYLNRRPEVYRDDLHRTCRIVASLYSGFQLHIHCFLYHEMFLLVR